MKTPRAIVFYLLAGFGLTMGLSVTRRHPGHSALVPLTDRSSGPLAPSVASPRAKEEPPPLTVAVAPAPAPDPFLQNLAFTLESLQKDTDKSTQDQKLEVFANDSSGTNLPAALEFLKTRNAFGPARDLSIRLVRRWTEQDPKAAADGVLENFRGTVREEAVGGVATVWANQDLAGALAWARQLPEDDRENGLLRVAYEAARTGPVAALNLALELPAGQSQEDLIVHAVRQWAAREANGPATWAKQITEQGFRDRVLAAVAAEWGESDPAAAATLAIKSVTPGKLQDDAVVGIVQRWVQKQPTEAAAWVTAFPEGPLRDAAMENVVKLWADQDLEQPGEWLATLEPGPGRDSAIAAYVGKVALLFPAAAASWAEGINGEVARNLQLQAVAESWMAADASTARAWVAQAPLPEESKARLLAERKQ